MMCTNIGPASGSYWHALRNSLIVGAAHDQAMRFMACPFTRSHQVRINTYQDVIDATNGATDYVTWEQTIAGTRKAIGG